MMWHNSQAPMRFTAEKPMSLRGAARVLFMARLAVGHHVAIEAGLGARASRALGMGRDPPVGVRHLHLVAGLAVLLGVVAPTAGLALSLILDGEAMLGDPCRGMRHEHSAVAPGAGGLLDMAGAARGQDAYGAVPGGPVRLLVCQGDGAVGILSTCSACHVKK